jgi:inositol-phosphate phosphatase/L-galactose 1-phosphate phosphatase/histidinol-phosphatase
MHIQDPFQQSLVEAAGLLADAARPVALRYFRQPLTVESKADASPVTIADREIEAVLRERIRAQFPGHGILGEEFGSEQLDAEHIWSVDPIDGTKSFVTGMPTFGTLVALLHQRQPLLGVIDMPAMGERWVGLAGQSTTFNGQPCRTRQGVTLDQALLYSTSPQQFHGEEITRYSALSKAVGLHRFGGDCYAYGMLASGWIDGVVEAELQPYDFLCLPPIIEGAGGKITDWEGQPLGLESDGRVLAAATPALHAQMLQALRA